MKASLREIFVLLRKGFAQRSHRPNSIIFRWRTAWGRPNLGTPWPRASFWQIAGTLNQGQIPTKYSSSADHITGQGTTMFPYWVFKISSSGSLVPALRLQQYA